MIHAELGIDTFTITEIGVLSKKHIGLIHQFGRNEKLIQDLKENIHLIRGKNFRGYKYMSGYRG